VPQADAATAARCAGLFDGTGVALWGRAGEPLFSAPIATLNAGAALLAQGRRHADAWHHHRGLHRRRGPSLWRAFETLATCHPGLTVVVADGTRLFIDSADLAGLARHGARLVALRPIRIAGITLNPFSPLGGHFDAAAFTTAARAAWPQHVVTDVLWDTDHPSEMELTHGPFAA
jgi:hypothetical protein